MKKNLLVINFIPALSILLITSSCNNRDWYPEVGPPLSAYVKYVNAVPKSNLDYYAYYTAISKGVIYGKEQPYVNSPFGNIVMSITNNNQTSNRAIATTSAPSPQMGSQGLVADFYQTLIACKRTDSTDADDLILLRDDLKVPAAGQVKVRFVNLMQRGANGFKLVDLKTPIGEGSKTLFSSVKYKVPSNAILLDPAKGVATPGLGVFTSGPFTEIAAGMYDFDITESGGSNSLVSKSGIELKAGKIYTLYSSGKSGDTSAPPMLNVLTHN